MARILSIGVVGIALSFLPAVLAHGTVGGLAAIVVGVALASTLGGRLSAASVAAGAAGALAFVALAPGSVGLAGGACLALAAIPRALRATRTVHAATLLVIAFVGGGLASWVVLSFTAAEVTARTASLVVAALLGGALVLWPVEDVLAARLLHRAGGERGSLRVRLLRAVAVRRRWVRTRHGLGRGARRSVERAFRSLLATVLRLDEAPRARAMAEPRVGTYVAQLTRATRAAERALALDERGDARVLAELRMTGEELALRADALAEVEAEVKAQQPAA